MRLFMTADAVGGVWTYATGLARGLSAHGVRTTLAVLGPAPSTAQTDQANGIAGLEIIETGLTLDWQAEDPHAVDATARQAAALARKIRADVVHLNSPSLAASGDFGGKVVGVCHSCLPTWWEATQRTGLPKHLDWHEQLLARGYARCGTLVAPSTAFARATARIYGVHPQVIHNGGDAPPLPCATRERCVITAGRLWDSGKNLHTLDRVASHLDAPVYAAGTLHMAPGSRVEVNYVTPLGCLGTAALRDRLNRAPVFASLAVYEPFGLTVLEAAQSGCALVLSDIPTFRELWSGAAIFVSPADVDGCASVLNALVNDPEAAAGWGAAARARSALYSLDRLSRAMLAVYTDLAASRSGVAA